MLARTIALLLLCHVELINGQCGGASPSTPPSTCFQYQCMDDPAFAATCQQVFCANGTTNSDACNNPAFAALVPYCVASCDMCAQYCSNSLSEEICMALASNCQLLSFFAVMSTYCPRTCGFCQRPLDVSCVDIAYNCSAIRSLCENPATFDVMTQNCRSTCGRCSISADCRDEVTNCQQFVGYCTNPEYEQLMEQQCRKTCGFCTKCADVEKDCIQDYLMKGFCWDKNVTDAERRSKCAKTCGLCDG